MTNNPHVNILVQLSKIDGEADGAELDVIRQIGASSNISDEDIEKAIESADALDPIPGLDHLSEEDKLELIFNLALVMKADGIIHKEEMKFCLAMVKKLGFEDDVLFELVNNTVVDKNLNTDKNEVIENARKFLKK